MVRVSSIFSQLLSLIDRSEFQKLVNAHQADKHSNGYSCWEQCVAMLFCQLAQARSIREICGGLACYVGKMRHLGFCDAPKKSTLAYANTCAYTQFSTTGWHFLSGTVDSQGCGCGGK